MKNTTPISGSPIVLLSKTFSFWKWRQGPIPACVFKKGKRQKQGESMMHHATGPLEKIPSTEKRFEELFQGRLPVHLRGLSIKEGITDQYRKAYLLTSYINCCENCRLDSRTLMVVFCLHNDSKRLGSGELFVLFHANYCWVLLTNELLNGGT